MPHLKSEVIDRTSLSDGKGTLIWSNTTGLRAGSEIPNTLLELGTRHNFHLDIRPFPSSSSSSSFALSPFLLVFLLPIFFTSLHFSSFSLSRLTGLTFPLPFSLNCIDYKGMPDSLLFSQKLGESGHAEACPSSSLLFPFPSLLFTFTCIYMNTSRAAGCSSSLGEYDDGKRFLAGVMKVASSYPLSR
ncbi:hypothetical protein V8C44DRAFT_348078 [Trichoderma aethiopicum]